MGKVLRKLKLFGLLTLVLLVAPASTAFAASQYPAAFELGQPNFATNSPAADDHTLYGPRGTAVDSVHHRLFVADSINNRVLVYDTTTLSNGQGAIHELGQPNINTANSGTDQHTMFYPQGLAYDPINDRLFVVDTDNERVLIYNTATITDGMDAVHELGQSDFGSRQTATNQHSMSNPAAVAYDSTHQRLFVSDDDNARVLVYDLSGTITDGMNAAHVLGQTDFITGGRDCGGNTNHAYCEPWGLAYDDVHNRLFVVDNSDNDRVLVYNTATITDGMAAVHQLGQATYGSDVCHVITQSSICEPVGVAYDPVNDRLFVSVVWGSSYIRVFDTKNIVDGENASAVLGAPDFTTDGACNNDQYSICDGWAYPAYDSSTNRLYVPDPTMDHVSVFQFVHITTKTLSTSSIQLGKAVSYSVAIENATGTVTYAVTSGTLPPGLSLNATTGLISGTPTTSGTYTFEISVTDNNGVLGAFTDDPQYTLTVAAAAAPDTGYGRPTSTSFTAAILLIGGAVGLAIGSYSVRRGMRR